MDETNNSPKNELPDIIDTQDINQALIETQDENQIPDQVNEPAINYNSLVLDISRIKVIMLHQFIGVEIDKFKDDLSRNAVDDYIIFSMTRRSLEYYYERDCTEEQANYLYHFLVHICLNKNNRRACSCVTIAPHLTIVKDVYQRFNANLLTDRDKNGLMFFIQSMYYDSENVIYNAIKINSIDYPCK